MNIFYRILSFLAGFYTLLYKYKFHSFGRNSVIKPFLNTANERHIAVGDNVDIGANCRITVSCDFGGNKVKSDNDVRLRIGNNVSIGNNAFISANNDLVIGNDVILSAYVFISDHDHGFSDMSRSIHRQPLTEGGRVRIGDNVFLGVKSTVLKNVTIGERSVVSANSVVTKDVPPYSMVAGVPARVIKKWDFERKCWIREG